MATQAEDALNNSFALNKMFSDVAAPINNFYSQSIAANFQKERDLRDQAFKQAEQQRNLESNEHLAKMAEDAADARTKIIQDSEYKKATDIAKLNFGLAQDAHTHDQAMALRADPNTQQVVGDLKKYPISKDGDAALVEDATQMKTPAVAEKIAKNKVIALNSSISQTIKSLSSGVTDPVAARAALQQFFSDATNSKMLIKKANLSADDINRIIQSGDFAELGNKIDLAAKNNWFGSDQVKANLVSSFMQARLQAAGNSPEKVADANLLQTQLGLRDKVYASGDIQSKEAFQDIQNSNPLPSTGTAPAAPVIPPPPKLGVLAPPPVAGPVGPVPFGGQGLVPGLQSALTPNLNFPQATQTSQSVNADALQRLLQGGPSMFDQPGYQVSPTNAAGLNAPAPGQTPDPYTMLMLQQAQRAFLPIPPSLSGF